MHRSVNSLTIIVIIGLAFFISLVVSFYIPRNLVVTSGEYIFSFDFKSHFLRLLYNTDWKSFESYVECNNCWAINHYSPYFSIMYMGVNTLGDLLGFYPFVFYIFIQLSIQLVASHTFLKLVFKKSTIISLFCIFIFLSLISYKVSLFSSGSWYGVTHGLLIIYYSILIYFFRSLELSFKKVAFLGLIVGIILSTTFSFTANYLPFTFYTTIFLLLFYIKRIYSKPLRSLLFGISILIPLLIFLFPIYTSLLISDYHSIRSFQLPANNEQILDAITIRQWSFAQGFVEKGLVLVIFTLPFILFFRNSLVKFSEKLFFVSLFIFNTILLMGNIFFINVYLFIFENFPLMHSMRSSHRLYFFTIILYLFLIALWMHTGKSKELKYFWTVCLSVLIVISGVRTVLDRFTFAAMPIDYFNVYEYMKSFEGSVLYLPGYLPLHNSIITTYSWAKDESSVQSIYLNPFSAYLPFDNLVSYEQYYYPEYNLVPIMSLDSQKFYDHLIENKIEYILYDSYFEWENFHEFKLDEQKFELIQTFGKLDIFKVKE
jgi:hypothetical protein